MVARALESLVRIVRELRTQTVRDQPDEDAGASVRRAIARAQVAQAKRLGYRDAQTRYDPEDDR